VSSANQLSESSHKPFDIKHPGNPPSIEDIWNLLVEIRNHLGVLERNQSEQVTAFPVNDLRKPDFDGHRKDHLAIREEKQIMDNYKTGITKKILSVIVVFVLGLIASGFTTTVSNHIFGHVK
jgi:hypothetical protein